MNSETARLTSFSHGAGCGCKIAPSALDQILAGLPVDGNSARVLVGAGARDDAAVYELNDEDVMICTTDFFMPIIDDPQDFGGIASVNAMSDVYAMGGRPVLGLAVLGWPVGKLPLEIANQVMRGAQQACSQAGFQIVGGHSIDAPEPFFGLSVTGLAKKIHIRRNADARAGCVLFLTKPLGVGIYMTAQKRGYLDATDLKQVREQMLTSNEIGMELGQLGVVATMTDVTGFGLLGHLLEVCRASGLAATLRPLAVPQLANVDHYLNRGVSTGGSSRNLDSYGHDVGHLDPRNRILFSDPQTSGGLLIASDPEGVEAIQALGRRRGLELVPIGTLRPQSSGSRLIEFEG